MFIFNEVIHHKSYIKREMVKTYCSVESLGKKRTLSPLLHSLSLTCSVSLCFLREKIGIWRWFRAQEQANGCLCVWFSLLILFQSWQMMVRALVFSLYKFVSSCFLSHALFGSAFLYPFYFSRFPSFPSVFVDLFSGSFSIFEDLMYFVAGKLISHFSLFHIVVT